MIKCADWIIDLGPEGGERGGEIVGVGTPEMIATLAGSYTGEYLRPALTS
jgi:excinuclease ABC subunit A